MPRHVQKIFQIVAFILLGHSLQSQSDTLIVGYSSAPPFVIEDDNHRYGISIWLWEKIAKDLDLNYRLERYSFSEMLDGVGDGQIDVSINPLTMTAARSRSFNFTSPFYVSCDTVVMKKKGRWEHLILILSTFFSMEFLGALLLLVITIGIFGWLTWIFERKKNSEQFRPGINGLWDGMWWSTVTMTTVGYGDKSPKSVGGKIVALVWMFSALIFLSGLTASIASILLRDQTDLAGINATELRSLDVGTMRNTGTEGYLRGRFYNHITTYDDIFEGLHSVEQNVNKAFIYDEPIIKYRLAERPQEKLEILPIKLNLQLYAFAVSKDRDDLRHDLSERILHYTRTIEWSVLLSEYELSVH